jgi:hypothetical protein
MSLSFSSCSITSSDVDLRAQKRPSDVIAIHVICQERAFSRAFHQKYTSYRLILQGAIPHQKGSAHTIQPR